MPNSFNLFFLIFFLLGGGVADATNSHASALYILERCICGLAVQAIGRASRRKALPSRVSLACAVPCRRWQSEGIEAPSLSKELGCLRMNVRLSHIPDDILQGGPLSRSLSVWIAIRPSTDKLGTRLASPRGEQSSYSLVCVLVNSHACHACAPWSFRSK